MGSGGDGDGKGPLWSVLWFLVCLLSFFMAGFCAAWYILFLPFTVCVEGLVKFTDLLLLGVQFPRFCAERAMEQKAMC